MGMTENELEIAENNESVRHTGMERTSAAAPSNQKSVSVSATCFHPSNPALSIHRKDTAEQSEFAVPFDERRHQQSDRTNRPGL